MLATPNSWHWNEQQAKLALEALNRRVAAIYRQEALEGVRVVFTDRIDQRIVRNFDKGQDVVVREVVGQCIQERKVIRLVVRQGWESTAVHEFVHLYNPGRTEAWVRKASMDVARLLKQGGLWKLGP